jgi:hypothetical protein
VFVDIQFSGQLNGSNAAALIKAISVGVIDVLKNVESTFVIETTNEGLSCEDGFFGC